MTAEAVTNSRSTGDAGGLALPIIVLVEPQGGANVGSACRALKNCGGGTLVCVRGHFDRSQARMMAVHAGDIFAARRQVDTLGEALSGAGLVVGTTARTGLFRERALPIREVARKMVDWQTSRGRGSRPAFVFGREDSGLTNDELAACHWVTRVPTSDAYSSLNLSQAVLLAVYELMLVRDARGCGDSPQAEEEDREAADGAQIEGMFCDLTVALTSIGFLGTDDGPHVMRTLRALLARAVLDAREVRMLRGVANQMRWFGEGGHAVVENKRSRGEKLR